MADDATEAGRDALLDEDAERHYEYAPCGYLSTGPDGLVLRANSTFLTMTGYTRPELVRRYTFAELLTVGGRIYHETHYAPMLEMQGSAREIAFDIVCADGTTLPVLVSAVLERGADGRQPVVRMAVFDAHDRREYERELLRAKERAEASEAHAQRLARTLQQTLIPPTPPTVPGLDVAAAYRPAGYGVEVGGDFYDVFQIAADRWVVAIGDVCGKGVDAAVVTALVRHTLRASSVLLEQPSASLRHLNDVLLAHETDRFCTVGLLRLQRLDEGWRVTAASAGHPLPLVLENGDSSVLGRPGSLLGVFEDIEVVDTERVLLPGQALLLYTDGVPDGRRGEEFYGEERLLLVAGKGHPTAADLTSAVLADLLAFQRGVARDDIAVLALRVPDQSEAAGRQA